MNSTNKQSGTHGHNWLSLHRITENGISRYALTCSTSKMTIYYVNEKIPWAIMFYILVDFEWA